MLIVNLWQPTCQLRLESVEHLLGHTHGCKVGAGNCSLGYKCGTDAQVVDPVIWVLQIQKLAESGGQPARTHFVSHPERPKQSSSFEPDLLTACAQEGWTSSSAARSFNAVSGIGSGLARRPSTSGRTSQRTVSFTLAQMPTGQRLNYRRSMNMLLLTLWGPGVT